MRHNEKCVRDIVAYNLLLFQYLKYKPRVSLVLKLNEYDFN